MIQSRAIDNAAGASQQDQLETAERRNHGGKRGNTPVWGDNAKKLIAHLRKEIPRLR